MFFQTIKYKKDLIFCYRYVIIMVYEIQRTAKTCCPRIMSIRKKKLFWVILMTDIEMEYRMKGASCVRLTAGKYTAVISPGYGASVWRMTDEEKGVEVFRYREDVTADEIDKAREIWGLPTLYLPNRFDRGILKTSDAEYRLPVNETLFDNFIHGWVHKRPHKVEHASADEDKATLVTSFTHDSSDPMYRYFPVDFKISYTFELSADKGLVQNVKLTSLSEKKLPVSICTHTCINAPIKRDGGQEGLRLMVPVGEKCELDGRCLPTEKLLPLGERDRKYKDGTMPPVLHDIDNDMYTACEGTLDGKPFYGMTVTDEKTGRRVCNEVSREFKFWNIWNDRGSNGYFCPEPMTAMINCANLGLPREVSGYAELSKGESFTCWQRFFTT